MHAQESIGERGMERGAGKHMLLTESSGRCRRFHGRKERQCVSVEVVEPATGQ